MKKRLSVFWTIGLTRLLKMNFISFDKLIDHKNSTEAFEYIPHMIDAILETKDDFSAYMERKALNNEGFLCSTLMKMFICMLDIMKMAATSKQSYLNT